MARPTRFAVRFSALFAVVSAIVGVTRRRADVTVEDGDVVVRMGWAFQARIPRASIVDARRHPRVWYAVGVHTYRRGDWIVNGTTGNIVELRIEPRVRAHALGFAVWLRRLRVSIDHPDELVDALSPKVARTTTGR